MLAFVSNKSRLYFISRSTQTTAPLDLYLSAATGSDANDGLTPATAVATVVRLNALIPQTIKHAVNIHCAAGTYVFGGFSPKNFLGGYIRVFADEAWDATVYSVLVSGAAAAGTTNAKIVTAGLTVDAHIGHSLRMTSGLAVNQWRMIRNNTATDLVPADIFGANTALYPVPGDNFQVVRPAVIFAAAYSYTGFSSVHDLGGWQIEGIGFTSTYAVQFSEGTRLFGVDCLDCLWVFAFGSVSAAPRGSVEGPIGANPDLGWMWGLSAVNLNQTGAEVGGFGGALAVRGTTYASTSLTAGRLGAAWIGGPLRGFATADVCSISQQIGLLRLYNKAYGGLNGDVDFLVGAGLKLEVFVDATCFLSDASRITGHSTGGVTVSCYWGGHVFMMGAPALGHAVDLDWQNGDGVGVNKSFFGAGVEHLYRMNTQERGG